jgi:hypothetical protein
MPSRSAMSRWVEQLQSRGRYTFTRAQAESDTGRSFVAAQTALCLGCPVLRASGSGQSDKGGVALTC